MKRKSNWREKLDDSTLGLLEGFRKAFEIRNKVVDPAAWHAKLEKIATEHPEIRVLKHVDVLPEFMERLLNSDLTANFVKTSQATGGSKTMSEPVAQFVQVMQLVTLGLEDPDMRIAAGVLSGIAAVVVGGIYDDISRSHFGEAGPAKEGKNIWTLGKVLEVLGKTLQGGKPPDIKGRVNVELVELIKVLLKGQKAKLTYRELQEALGYVGIPIDEEALRLFMFRARKRGWINPKATNPDP
jgi:hypothetical protein